MTRWHCTSEDLALCIVTIVAASLMFGLYVYYAIQSHLATRTIKESHFVAHLRSLRNVFLVCGAIHLLSSAVSWFWTPYWFIVAAMLVNCGQCIALISSKSKVLAIQQHMSGEHAMIKVYDALTMIRMEQHRATVSGVSEALDRLEKVLRRES